MFRSDVFEESRNSTTTKVSAYTWLDFAYLGNVGVFRKFGFEEKRVSWKSTPQKPVFDRFAS